MHPSMTKKKRLSGQSGTGWRAQAELSRSPLETLVANAVLTVAVYLAGYWAASSRLPASAANGRNRTALPYERGA
jgi:hypothetical protein